MKIRTGNAPAWEPEGFVVRLDTSWDGRGDHVAVRSRDVIKVVPGCPESLGYVVIREGAEVLLGDAVFALRPKDCKGNSGLGYSWQGELSAEEAESAFAAAL